MDIIKTLSHSKRMSRADIVPLCAQIPADNLSALLFDLSMICKENGWHKSGLHLFIAAEELTKMLEANEKTQKILTPKDKDDTHYSSV